MPDTPPRVDDYVLLGRSGLRVSRLCLGTMTFGTEWGWGSAESAAREMFDRYLDAGGNFVDTADGYTAGTSETLVGKFIRDHGNRDRVVLATKFTFGSEPGNPNSGGNGRKNIHRALEGVAAAAADRLRRPVLAARLGRAHPDGGGALDARRAGARREGAGHRLLRRAGVVPRPRADHRRVPRLGVHLRTPARVLARGAEHRARARPGGAGPRGGHLPLESPGERDAEREVPARPVARGTGAARGGAEIPEPRLPQALHRPELADRRHAGRGRQRDRTLPRTGGARTGWHGGRPSPRSSSARPSRHSSTTTSPRSPSSCRSRSGAGSTS